MARFCTKCGSPAANDQVKFCAKCGTALPAPAATTGAPSHPRAAAPPPAAQPVAAAPAPPAAPPAAAKSSGPWVKIIVGVLGFLALVTVLGLGTCAYLGYRLKQKVEQAKSEYGLDKLGSLSSKIPSGSSSPSTNVQGRDVCSLLSKEEVTEITGVTITEARGSTEKCDYASATNPTVAEVTVTWQNGATSYKMLAVTMKLNTPPSPSVPDGTDPVTGKPRFKKLPSVLQNLPGIGDEAIMMTPFQGEVKEDWQRDMKRDSADAVSTAMLKGMRDLVGQFPLAFRKGDVMVMVGVSESHDPDEAKKAMAAKIAPRI